MKTIFVINDNSDEAGHAAEFALLIAQKMQANIILANTFIKHNKLVEKIQVGDIDENGMEEQPIPDMVEHLKLLNNIQSYFKPEIEEFDISDMDESKLSSVINKNQIGMMVKGMANTLPKSVPKRNLNVHVVLNKVLCPLLLIPANWQLKNIDRLVYIADLRYCRIQIVKYLAGLAKPWQADLSIAHFSAKGLPDMEENYALSVFNEGVCRNINYDQLFFNNIKEKDLTTVVDVMINGLRNDLLVLVNRHFHFEEIIGRYITDILPLGRYINDTLPLHITIPLLIFPY